MSREPTKLKRMSKMKKPESTIQIVKMLSKSNIYTRFTKLELRHSPMSISLLTQEKFSDYWDQMELENQPLSTF